MLQLGCGNGYLTALLAKLALSVELCDVDEKTIHTTKHCLKSLGIYNVKYRNSHDVVIHVILGLIFHDIWVTKQYKSRNYGI